MNCIATKDRKQLYYLNFVKCHLKLRGGTTYDVFDNLPVIPVDQGVNPKKSSQSKLTWNGKVKKK